MSLFKSANNVYKKLLVLDLNKGSCSFITSDFPSENPRTQKRTILIQTIVLIITQTKL